MTAMAENVEKRQARGQLQEYPALHWLTLELRSERDLPTNLRWLDLAYRVAR